MNVEAYNEIMLNHKNRISAGDIDVAELAKRDALDVVSWYVGGDTKLEDIDLEDAISHCVGDIQISIENWNWECDDYETLDDEDCVCDFYKYHQSVHENGRDWAVYSNSGENLWEAFRASIESEYYGEEQ